MSNPPLPAEWKKVCAWCKAHMAGDPAATLISHGICPACLAEEERKEAHRAMEVERAAWSKRESQS